MKRSVDEKLRYNESRKGMFSVGYRLAVKTYRDYPKQNAKGRKIIKELITDSNELARTGDGFGKGFMCGVRDAANERKARKKDRPP